MTNKPTKKRIQQKHLDAVRKKAEQIELEMRKLRQQFLRQQREDRYKNIHNSRAELLKLFSVIKEFKFYSQLLDFIEEKNLSKVASLIKDIDLKDDINDTNKS